MSNQILTATATCTAAVVAAVGGTLLLGKTPSPLSAPAPLATWDPVRPLASLTPGVVDPKLTFQVLTTPGFTTKTYRNVPQSEKDAVYREYGIDPKHHVPTEIDHLCSLEIGGANDLGNLWPEAYSIQWQGFEAGAHTKDKLEDFLAAQIRAGKVPLGDAQEAIRTDWIAAHRKYLGELPRYAGPISGQPEGE